MHRHRAQRYRREFSSNRMGIPISQTMICSFQRRGEMGLTNTWSLVISMSFYCCLGTVHQAVFMNHHLGTSRRQKLESPTQCETSRLWSGSGPLPQSEGLFDRKISCQIQIPLLRSHGTKVPRRISQDGIFELCVHEPYHGTFQTTPEADPPFKPAKNGQIISSGIQLEAVAMGFFRCWLMSSLARDTWMCS